MKILKKLKFLIKQRLWQIIITGGLLSSIPVWSIFSSTLDQINSYIEWKLIKPEKSREILILIAPFRYLNVNNNEEYKKIGKQVGKLFSKYRDNLPLHVRVEYLPYAIDKTADITEAENYAFDKNATIIIWGEIAETHNEIRYLNRFYQKNNLTWSGSELSVKHIENNEKTHLVDVMGYSEFVNKNLPCVITFLSHITVADILFNQQQSDLAKKLYELAVKLNCSNSFTSIQQGLTEILQRLMYIRSLTHDASTKFDLQELLNQLIALSTDNQRNSLEKINLQMQITGLNNEDIKNALEIINAILDDWTIAKSATLYIDALLLRAHLLELLNKPLEAVNDREKALKKLLPLNRENFDYGVLLRQIDLYFKLGKYHHLKDIIDEAYEIVDLKKSPFFVRYLAEMDTLYHAEIKDYSRATQAVDKLILYSVTSLYKGHALRKAADLYNMMGDEENELSMREKVLHEGIPSSWDYHNLGRLYHVNKPDKCIEALYLFEKALSIHKFQAAKEGLLISLICSEDQVAIKKELNEIVYSIKNDNEPSTAAKVLIKVMYFRKLEAANAFLENKNWPTTEYTANELDELISFAFNCFLSNRKTNFAIWMLTSLLESNPSHSNIRYILGYLYSYEARKFLTSNQINKAVSILAEATNCCPLDVRIEGDLIEIFKHELIEEFPRSLYPNTVHFIDYSHIQANQNFP